MKIKVIVQKGENGYFVAHFPLLKSCWSQGKTKEEALKNRIKVQRRKPEGT